MKTIKSLLFVWAALLAFGCGGSGDDGPSTGRSGDALIGSWSGAYSQDEAGGVDGTISVAIRRSNPTDDFVGVTGTAVDSERGQGRVEGVFADKGSDGPSVISIVFPNTPSGDLVGSRIFGGKLKRNGDDHLVGPLNLAFGDFNVSVDFDLAAIP